MAAISRTNRPRHFHGDRRSRRVERAENVAWKIDVPGSGWSSPVLSDDKIYLTTAMLPADAPQALGVFCYDAKTGKKLWGTEVFRPDPNAVRKMHHKNSPASATPIVTNDRLYVHFGHLGTAALDLSGKVIWRQTSLAYPPVHGNGGSPILINGSLIFSCDGGQNPFVAALDASRRRQVENAAKHPGEKTLQLQHAAGNRCRRRHAVHHSRQRICRRL